MQRIPLPIHPDWAPVEEIVNWPAIGTLSEVVVSVSPTAQSGSATGSIAIDIRFKRLSILRKLGMSPWAQVRRRVPGQPGRLVARVALAVGSLPVAGTGADQ